MHEQAVMRDLVRRLEDAAREEEGDGIRVTRIKVRLGALSHFTPEHFREHFEDAAVGTVAEGAEVEAELSTDISEPSAQGVVLESVELEFAE